MMDISKMSDQEKSMLLARAMGWKLEMRPDLQDELPLMIFDDNIGISYADSLYRPANMALAWRVLNWAMNQPDPPTSDQRLWSWLAHWWTHGDSEYDPDGWLLLEQSPADAQRFWLDKILEFAIEAGIIEEE